MKVFLCIFIVRFFFQWYITFTKHHGTCLHMYNVLISTCVSKLFTADSWSDIYIYMSLNFIYSVSKLLLAITLEMHVTSSFFLVLSAYGNMICSLVDKRWPSTGAHLKRMFLSLRHSWDTVKIQQDSGNLVRTAINEEMYFPQSRTSHSPLLTVVNAWK